jgi:SAM-dependent methyltransferase
VTEDAARPYAFGDDETAQRRLDHLHNAFEPATRALLASVADRAPSVAVDLGCGLGNTTVLVHTVTGAGHTVGLDASPEFLQAARRRWSARPDVTFARHDVRTVPLPVAAPDLVFARLVLGHLADPSAVLARWEGQLAPGGRLVLDEVEWIRTDDGLFERYLRLAGSLLTHGGGRMYAGPLIADHQPRAGAFRRNAVTEFAVPAPVAAGLFALNLEVFGPRAQALGLTDAGERAELASGLDLRRRGGGPAALTWGLRQAVLEADGG